jgi:hypothetical protein
MADDDAKDELTWSGRRRRAFIDGRRRVVVAVSAAVTAVVVGLVGPWVWRLYNPTMNLSNTAELALDLWAQRREFSISWRACDDRADASGWHECRVSIGGVAPEVIWCGGDRALVRTCSFERPLSLPLAPARGSARLDGMAQPDHTTITPPTTTPDNLPPEAGGPTQKQNKKPDDINPDSKPGDPSKPVRDDRHPR